MHAYRVTLYRVSLLTVLPFGLAGLAAAAESNQIPSTDGPSARLQQVSSQQNVVTSAAITAITDIPALAAIAPEAGSAESEISGIGQPLATDALGEMRGGDSTTIDNDIVVNGEVTDNHAENIISGTNVIDGGAFGNASGISTVIQNSGSNVLIQNAMIVNVQFAPPP